MYTTFPGTTIEAGASQRSKPDSAAEVLNNIFAAGGLVLSQVSSLTGLEYYIIQNWVKRGFLSPPVKKQYSKRQFCRIATINILKETLQIDMATKLLSYINGVLSDESDDLVDDFELYNYYVNMVFSDDGNTPPEESIKNVLKNYKEPVPGALKRLSKVLLVMYYAGQAAKNARKCNEILYELS
ncbi:MAG: DUF1836 domain-containing protein [Eubacteriales bacterium]|nr:DUF1836 domain-containing protein [Eubacteriales bacterium]